MSGYNENDGGYDVNGAPSEAEIPPGKYRARAVEAALGLTESGKEQVAVLFEVTEGGFAGYRLTWYGYFHGRDPQTALKNQKRTIESLRYCGWQGNDLDDLSGIDANEVQIVVERDVYEGRVRSKVAWVNRLGAGLALQKPLPPDQAKAFAARMKGLCMQITPEPTQQGAPTRTSGPGAISHTDDDIPF